ncbi:hypothetical protein AHiyo8_57080 [Arthrobacter sp. Hiyo8]|nr:hypothetical protein AHiyo8_57080 [Arthrobacter sp. Hiyo8]
MGIGGEAGDPDPHEAGSPTTDNEMLVKASGSPETWRKGAM